MLNNFIQHTGIVAPLDIVNIDTDTIIPKQFLHKISRIGFGKNLFHNWRYEDVEGKKLNLDFILNKKEFQFASILLTRENFGCGSSREHAVWALMDFGFRVIIAPSFADIFYKNSINNKLLPIQLSIKEINEMFYLVVNHYGVMFKVDIKKLKIITENKIYQFEIDDYHHKCMMNGIDNITSTLEHESLILNYEQKNPDFFIN
ncbi:3-isopropylmalate dehydratase small subunit [Candidatus Pantoea edessiphila]|uniref:3-isopropylmalate dehydratase small subunit n=1 Tax=Candidatus Pantoea edessiphila TaxID=2044610 RepID=A0A2P5SY75_9GAMM|nr:3-isopropylmalate dehydratase small subunit [Candidatus Pantoea edessiphila]MBK4775601.1 3-isopropylmalate dehydratase small subunit [Pantoea sp. Edef]PPI87250.1 3-isopropylmalate dehydratase small subunit [Candidatus Pantoea edessiphila]